MLWQNGPMTRLPSPYDGQSDHCLLGAVRGRRLPCKVRQRSPVNSMNDANGNDEGRILSEETALEPKVGALAFFLVRPRCRGRPLPETRKSKVQKQVSSRIGPWRDSLVWDTMLIYSTIRAYSAEWWAEGVSRSASSVDSGALAGMQVLLGFAVRRLASDDRSDDSIVYVGARGSCGSPWLGAKAALSLTLASACLLMRAPAGHALQRWLLSAISQREVKECVGSSAPSTDA